MSSPGRQTDRTSVAARLRATITKRIVWLTDERRDLLGQPTTAPALVAIVGREHYVERRRKYPIHSRRDLDAVLAQELAHAPVTLTLIGEPEQDKREVAFFELRPDAMSKVGRAIWLLPESAVLARSLTTTRVASVDRDGFRYFLAANGTSQPAGGIVDSVDVFALATGLDAGGSALRLDRALALERLKAGMRALPLPAWLRLRRPSAERRLPIAWRPLAITLAAGMLAYLALASGYLWWARESREAKLEKLGSEVESLLAAQRQVDVLASQRQGLAALLGNKVDTYRIWQVASVVWASGATLNSIELKDRELTLRGSAPVATEVLAAVDRTPGVEGASFSAPVRGKGGTEDFVISLTLVREAQGG